MRISLPNGCEFEFEFGAPSLCVALRTPIKGKEDYCLKKIKWPSPAPLVIYKGQLRARSLCKKKGSA